MGLHQNPSKLEPDTLFFAPETEEAAMENDQKQNEDGNRTENIPEKIFSIVKLILECLGAIAALLSTVAALLCMVCPDAAATKWLVSLYNKKVEIENGTVGNESSERSTESTNSNENKNPGREIPIDRQRPPDDRYSYKEPEQYLLTIDNVNLRDSSTHTRITTVSKNTLLKLIGVGVRPDGYYKVQYENDGILIEGIVYSDYAVPVTP